MAVAILLLVAAAGCQGREEGEITFPPRKATFPLAMNYGEKGVEGDIAKPEYSYKLKQVDASN